VGMIVMMVVGVIIVYTTYWVHLSFPNTIIGIYPGDHYTHKEKAFHNLRKIFQGLWKRMPALIQLSFPLQKS
jgi:hypothetical protein